MTSAASGYPSRTSRRCRRLDLLLKRRGRSVLLSIPLAPGRQPVGERRGSNRLRDPHAGHLHREHDTATQTTPGEGGTADHDHREPVRPLAHGEIVPGRLPSGGFIAGRTVVYRIDVTNQGPSAAKNITMTDALPTGLTYVTAVGDGWSCSLVVDPPTCTSSAILPPGGSAPPIFLTAFLDPGATGQGDQLGHHGAASWNR